MLQDASLKQSHGRSTGVESLLSALPNPGAVTSRFCISCVDTLRSMPESTSFPPRLKGKIALISGGSSGIGRSTVQLFVLHGARVIVLDRDPPVVPFEGNVVLQLGSVALESDWDAAIQLSIDSFGETPNVLVQSAGIIGKSRLHLTTLEEWERTFAVNSTGIWLGMKHFINPLLESDRAGTIVNISSVAGLLGCRAGVSYEASKGACTQMSRSAAVDYANEKIRVNSISPGLVKTELTEKSNRPEEEKQRMLSHTPLGRWGHPDEVAASILFLCSDEACFVTGLTFTCDGGWTAS